jgi:hypothetical protein
MHDSFRSISVVFVPSFPIDALKDPLFLPLIQRFNRYHRAEWPTITIYGKRSSMASNASLYIFQNGTTVRIQGNSINATRLKTMEIYELVDALKDPLFLPLIQRFNRYHRAEWPTITIRSIPWRVMLAFIYSRTERRYEFKETRSMQLD